MARLDLNPEQLLTTTRAVRRRLDLTRPVERDVIETCLRMAFQAPNGSNRQTWGWVLVDDPALKREMAAIYHRSLQDFVEKPRRTSEGPPSIPQQQRMTESVMYLTEHMADVPVLLVPTFHGRVENKSAFWQATHWGSVTPAIWSFMLALRLHGLGSSWTTLHLLRETEMADLLGIPPAETQAGLFPIAYTLGTDFKPADRSLSEARIRWNHW